MRAGAEVARERALRELAERLREELPRVPSTYRAGRAALVDALAGLEDLSKPEATALLTELEELGAIKYTTEGRGIGAAGVWTYPRTTSARPRVAARASRRRAVH